MNVQTIRILSVDDPQIVCEGLRRMISEQPGMQVVGEAALKLTRYAIREGIARP